MAQIVLLPKEGITVESCLIGVWKKDIGDKVAEGEALFDYETDKAAFECISTAEGVLLHKFYKEGDEAEVLTPAAIVGAMGEDISQFLNTGAVPQPERFPAEGSDRTAAEENTETAAEESVRTVTDENTETVAKGSDRTAAEENAETVAEGSDKTAAEENAETAAEESSNTATEEDAETATGGNDKMAAGTDNKMAAEESVEKVTEENIETAAEENDKTAAEEIVIPLIKEQEEIIVAELPVSESEANVSGKIKASSRAKIFAVEHGVDLASVVPTGPGGRILEADIIAAVNSKYSEAETVIPLVVQTQSIDAADPPAVQTQPVTAAAPSIEQPPADKQPDAAVFIDERFSRTREVIAKTMMLSLQRSAQLTHHHSFDATNVLKMREDFKMLDEKYGYKGVSVGDIILYVTSRVLAKHPEINALVAEDGIRKNNTVNLGVAVDTPHGLLVPTIFRAEKKTLREISSEVKWLAAAAKERRIRPELLSGGTFTVSNLGATGVEMFTPIINPPQAAIIGVCGVVERVRKGEGEKVEVYPSIGISLTYDHRAIDGAPASRFNAELCEALARFSWMELALGF